MSQDRRMSSLARRMNRSWFFRLLLILLTVDVLLAAMLTGGFCWDAEKEAREAGKKITQRQLIWDKELPVWKRLDAVSYSFSMDGEEPVVVSNPEYFKAVRLMMRILLIAEIMILIGQYHGGKRRAKRLLAPLEKMAYTAQELSRSRFNPEKLHHLEDVIATVSPTNPEVKLKTGDQELQGLEKAINDLLARMQESYRQQSRFVSDASHELRTPIAVIQGYADMLSRWGKSDEKVLEEGIAAIQGESAHMKTLIEQLLFLARGDSGRNQVEMAQMDLSEMIREVFEESRMIHENRNWQCQAEGKIMVQGDRAMLKQTARILIDNAVKYTAEGDKITLRSRYKEGTPCFEVQDNGIGIKEEDMNHIFDRFFRADPARTRANGGTGLGLSIAKWIVERHGGYFDIFSREEFGTRIGVVLPQEDGSEK